MAHEGHISIMVTRALIPISLAILFPLEPFKSTETDASLFWKSQLKHQKPHIIVIMADDVGRNDFGIFGSNQIFTPNIDALGYNGIILDRFYTESVCTPSRAAFLTGKYPTRAGLQGVPVEPGEDVSIPLDMPTMAEQLRKLGYKTHMVGKWHLGAARRVNTPIGRGFDTHYGYWNGFTGYFDHTPSSSIDDTDLEAANEKYKHIRDPKRRVYAGGNLADLGKIDGVSQWETLSKNLPSKRTEILIDINKIEQVAAIIMKEDHKLVKYVNGSSRGGIFEQYSGDSGRESGTPPYNIEAVLQSDVNIALGQSLSPKKIHNMRNQLDLAWCRDSAPFLNCSTPCLFDLEVDPCETTNLVKKFPHITYKLQQRLGEFYKELVPQQSPGVDPASNPKYYNNTWCTWLDDKLCPKTPFFK